MPGDIVADDQVLVVQLEPFSFYPAVLEYDVEAFFQLMHIGSGILPDDPEEDGQVGMVSSKPLLQITGLANFVQVPACFQYIDTVLTCVLFHLDGLDGTGLMMFVTVR